MRVDYSVLRPTADGSITSVANCTWQVCVKPPLRSTPSTGVASAARQDAKPKGVTSVVPACKAYWSGARRNTALSPTVDQTVELGPATALRGTAADPKRYWTWTSNNGGRNRGPSMWFPFVKASCGPSVHDMVMSFLPVYRSQRQLSGLDHRAEDLKRRQLCQLVGTLLD